MCPRQDEDLTFLSNTVAPDYFRTLQDRRARRSRVRASRRCGGGAGGDRQRDDGAAVLGRSGAGDRASASDSRRTNGGRVIGVVRDVKYSRVNETSRPYVYVPFLQSYRSGMMIHARGAAGLIDVARTQIAALDPDLLLLEARSLREQTSASLAILQMAANMLFIFGVAGMAARGSGDLRPRLVHGEAEHARNRHSDGAGRPTTVAGLDVPGSRRAPGRRGCRARHCRGRSRDADS